MAKFAVSLVGTKNIPNGTNLRLAMGVYEADNKDEALGKAVGGFMKEWETHAISLSAVFKLED